MKAGPIDHGRLLDRWEQLFTPDPRLGWVFRDRWWFLKPLTEPAPEPQHMPDYLQRRVQETEQRLRHRMSRTLPLSIIAAVILLLFSGCSESDYALSRTPIPLDFGAKE